MTRPLHAVIMAGGSGTRFWPASRKARPKQFLPLAEGKPLLQATVDRVAKVAGPQRTWIVTNGSQAQALPQVLDAFPMDRVIVEPTARDTAPCVALAVATVAATDPTAAMAFLPADHVIRPEAAFCELLDRGAELASDNQTLVTFGIRPTHPATGYGYVERGESIDNRSPRASTVARFREKPDLKTATQFVADGGYAWNSGIFVWTAAGILHAMDHAAPELASATRAMQQAIEANDNKALHEAFMAAPATSIDYAVMEHAPRVVVVDADLNWDDVGSFAALGAVSPTDTKGNVTSLHRDARGITEDSTGNRIYGEGPRTIALFGVSDLVVVAVDDAVLVCPVDRAEELKALIAKLPEAGLADLL